MPRQYRNARLSAGLSMEQAANDLGISKPTLCSWETNQKSPSIDKLANMAELYGVTTDYLLGRSVTPLTAYNKPIDIITLSILHRKPIWSSNYGWLMVDAISKKLIADSSTSYEYGEAGTIYYSAPPYSEASFADKKLLSRSELSTVSSVWVEPVTTDTDLRDELHGWYEVKDRYVVNEYGNRFYFDTYEAKWLAFINE